MQVIRIKEWSEIPNVYTGIVEHPNGAKSWYKNGLVHREDGPAVEYSDGAKEWWINGKYHREDGPAREWLDGTKQWWLNGKSYSEAEWKVAVEKLKESELPILELKAEEKHPANYTGIVKWDNGNKAWFLNGECHRVDGPAIEFPNGTKHWYLNGQLHRKDGPAIEWADGHKEWFLNDKLHRENGPAREHPNGDKIWFLNNELHREDGPACEYPNGLKVWYLNGDYLFELLPESQPFVLLEEFVDEEDREQIKVLNQKGVKIWKSVPGLRELADNWESVERCKC